MSTNKTANYGLHLWEPGDDFLRAEFNANFSALDGAVGELVALGSYTGDGAESQFISLGFTPRAVFVNHESGYTAFHHNSTGRYYGGLSLAGHPLTISEHTVLSVESGGFRVYLASNPLVWTNLSADRFYYAALR